MLPFEKRYQESIDWGTLCGVALSAESRNGMHTKPADFCMVLTSQATLNIGMHWDSAPCEQESPISLCN